MLAAAVLLLTCVLVQALPVEERKSNRVHQHLQAQQPEPCLHGDEIFCTHLPVVRLETDGTAIPGEPIRNEEGNVVDFTLSESGEKMIRVNMDVLDRPGINHHLQDEPTVSSGALVRYRGNSSRAFPKKSYLIRLVNEDGGENRQEIMGMAAHDEWALYGPFLDKTMVRNYICLNIGAEIMGYAPNVRFCEVFVDGSYQGVYLMMETIARDENRVSIRKNKERDFAYSYIVRIDKDEENDKKLDTLMYYTLILDPKTGVSCVYPPLKSITPEKIKYIEEDLSQFEKALFSYDFKDPRKGYKAYIDVDSFVDYYIYMEFLSINDFGTYSTYLYKDKGGKLTIGPIWDFNNAMENFIRDVTNWESMQYTDRAWYKQLLRDEDFVERVVRRYRSLRKTWLNEDYWLNYIDATIDFLGDAVERNYEVWGWSFDPSLVESTSKLRPEERNPRSYEEAVGQMKDYIIRRGRWMDEHIDTLYQYCHETKNRKYIQ